jgi:hypothetical protein
MLRIVDYAKRSGMEWYQVLRNVISNEAPPPIVIPTQGEIAVLRTDENHYIEAYPGVEHINLAYEECELNPVLIARIIHAKFPLIFRSYVTVTPGSGEEIANNVFDFDDIPLKPKTLYQYQGQEKVMFSFRKEVRLSLDNIWMPSETESTMSVKSSHESLTERKPRKQLTPHTIFIAHQIQLGKIMLNSWQYFKKLAAESRGSELIDLPGYGSIYLKLDPKDIKSTVLWSLTQFSSPKDGKAVKKSAFDRAWNRVKGQK